MSRSSPKEQAMPKQHMVAVIVGSLRKESISRRVAHAAIALAPPSMSCAIVEIGALPLYNQDHEADPPRAVHDFKAALANMNAVLWVTPEYNRSVPGVLKNAIDVGSRPYGQGIWHGKPAAILSLSPGAIGAFGANHHLRQSLVFLNMPAMAQPEVYMGHAAKLLDDKGAFNTPATQKLVRDFMEKFATWITHNAAS